MTRESKQDRTYLNVEADAFFERNHGNADPGALRATKQTIVDAIDAVGIKPERVLEYGCNYGDLLQHYADRGAHAVGVEPSLQAVEFGRGAYGDRVRLHQGTLAQNPVNDALEAGSETPFDLVVVEDVFCWVSRETLFQSIANVDAALADGGYLFLREFAAQHHSKNRNHHVEAGDVYCFKPAMTHARMLEGTGVYAIVHERIWMDGHDSWIQAEDRDPFQSRWSDAILRKSLHGYYR